MWLPAISYRAPQAYIFGHFSIYYKLAEAYQVKIVETANEAEEVLKEEGRVGFILHMEGAEAIDDPYDLILFKRLGLRSLGITWNYNNKYGSRCMSKKDYRLTSEGEELVRTANKLGIIVDLAHASKYTILEAIEASSKPVMISHANVRKFVDTPRNVDQEILEALYRKGGVIGLSVLGSLITNKPRPTLDDLVQHFLYVYENFGVELIAVGTDFHGLMGLPAPGGLESIDKLQELMRKLAEKGLGDDDLRKIAYENALRLKANFT
jgi:membrane dipeptidase